MTLPQSSVRNLLHPYSATSVEKLPNGRRISDIADLFGKYCRIIRLD